MRAGGGGTRLATRSDSLTLVGADVEAVAVESAELAEVEGLGGPARLDE